MNPRVLFVGRTRYRLPLAGRPRAQVGRALGADGRARRRERDGLAIRASTSCRRGRSTGRSSTRRCPCVRRARSCARSGRTWSSRRAPYEAAAAEVARALARSRAKVVVEVHGDWRVWSSHYGSRARALLRPVERRGRGLGGRPRRRPPRRLGLHRVARRGAWPRAARRLHDLLRPRRVHRAARAGARRAAGAVRRRARALQERRGARGGVAARRPARARGAAPPGRDGDADRGGARGSRATGASWDRRLEPAEVAAALDAVAGAGAPVGVGGPAAGRGRVVPARPGRRRDARRRDPGHRRGRGERPAGRARRHRGARAARSSGC